MIVAQQNQIWDQQKQQIGTKTPKQLKQRFLTEILGTRQLYSLRRNKKVDQSSFLIQGVNVSQEKDTNLLTIEQQYTIGKAQTTKRTQQQQKFVIDKQLQQLKTENQDYVSSIENKTDHSKQSPTINRTSFQAFQAQRQNQTKILNVQFKVDQQQRPRVQSLSHENNFTKRTILTNHRLKLKTIENRLMNKYYTIQLSNKSSNLKKDPLEISDDHILKYRSVHIGQKLSQLQSIWG